MKRHKKILSDYQLHLLASKFEPIRLSADSDIVYEDQIPFSGLVLVEGEAVLTKKKKITEKIEPGTMLGVKELILNKPVKHGCRVREKAKVIFLNRSEISEILSGEDEELKKTIQ